MTDEQVRELLKSSPAAAHRAIFDEYYNYVYTIIFSRLRSIASVEDIEECISDVFSDVFMRYDPKNAHNGDIKGFVAAIAKNRSIDMYRRLSSRMIGLVSLDNDEALQLSSPEKVDEITEKAETGNAVLNAVSSLGEPDSTIIMQKYYYGRNSTDIADMVGMKADAVRKRLSRAMDKLKKILTEIGEGR